MFTTTRKPARHLHPCRPQGVPSVGQCSYHYDLLVLLDHFVPREAQQVAVRLALSGYEEAKRIQRLISTVRLTTSHDPHDPQCLVRQISR